MIDSPWIRMIAIASLIGGWLVVLRALQRKYSPHPELVRKMAHVGTGLVAISLPFLFHKAWPVVLLCAFSLAGMLAIRLTSKLKREFGAVLHGVDRSSQGEIYFPISVAIVFVLARDNPLIFVIPMLILTFADALAALAGGRYGLTRYAGTGGGKTAEGSVAFFLVAFLSSHIPLLLHTDTGRAKTLLIGLTIGLVATLLEAIAGRGLDNLFIPLGVYILLQNYLRLNETALVTQFCVVLLLFVLLQIFRRYVTIDTTGLFGVALFCYIWWSLEGWRWLVPPLVFYVAYPLLTRRTQQNMRRIHSIYAVLSVASAGLLWVYLSRVLGGAPFYFPFTLGVAAHLAIIGTTRTRREHPERIAHLVMTKCVLLGWLIVFVPYYLVQGWTQTAAVQTAAGLAIVALATMLFSLVQPHMENCAIDGRRWFRQATVVLSCSALCLIVNYALTGHA